MAARIAFHGQPLPCSSMTVALHWTLQSHICLSATMLGPCRWAVDEDEANGPDQSAQQTSSKRSKPGKQTAHSGLKQEDDKGQAGEGFDGLTASLDGLIDPKSGKGKSGPASHATSKVSASKRS